MDVQSVDSLFNELRNTLFIGSIVLVDRTKRLCVVNKHCCLCSE